MRHSMALGSVALVAAIAAALGTWTGAASAQDTLRFGKIPSTVRNVGSLYLSIAERKGFFARERIAIQSVMIEGGTDRMVAALDAGTIDITHSSTPYLISAVLAGSDAVGIAGEVGNPVYTLIVRPEITSYADLKGKTIGLSIGADTISITTRKLLAKHGLRDGDYQTKELVGTPVRFECLKRGECAGVPLGQPNDITAVREGFRRLGDSTEAVGAFQFQVIAARRAFATANKDKVVRFVRAIADSFRFIRAPENRAEVIKAIVEQTGSSEDIARAVVALYFEPDRGAMPRQAEIDLKGLTQVIDFMGEAGTLKAPLPPAERFVDLQYLRAAGIE
jgi:ABC-type nitrate/sulfonate/bicarbonate transport system substrate-binding protein